jgi:hypothetical protein
MRVFVVVSDEDSTTDRLSNHSAIVIFDGKYNSTNRQ